MTAPVLALVPPPVPAQRRRVGDVSDVLRKASAVFATIGGATRTGYDPATGQVCVIGAVRVAVGCELDRHGDLENPFDVLSDADFHSYVAALNALEHAAEERFGLDVLYVNDELGRPAAQALFRDAIRATAGR